MIARAVIGLAAVFAVAIAAVVGPTQQAPTQVGSLDLDVVPAAQRLACPGSLALPVGADPDATGALGSGSKDVRFSGFSNGDEPVAAGEGWSFDAALATTIERIGGGDLAGLAAVACVAPSTDAWLLGGSTTVGHSARLVLTNPTTAPSEATVTIHGAAGAVSPQVTVAVGAGATQQVLLEAVAAGVDTVAVHVEATGAGVVATLQDSRLDGFIPEGTDWVPPSPAAATSLVIPAVGPSNTDDGISIVRLLSPEGGEASLRLVDNVGEVAWPGVAGITLEAGTVVDVQLPVAVAGAVLVESTAPVMASAMTTQGRVPEDAPAGSVARDLVWVQGHEYVEGRDLRAMVTHYKPAVAVYAHQDTTVVVTEVATGKVLVEQRVTRGTSVRLPLDVPGGTEVAVTGDVSWVVLVGDLPGFVTAIEPTDVTEDPVGVLVAPAPYSETGWVQAP